MPLSIVNDVQNVTTEYWTFANVCPLSPSPYTATGNRTLGRSTVQYNDPESRPKPIGLLNLVQSQTPQALQYTEKNESIDGFYRSGTVQKYCGAPVNKTVYAPKYTRYTELRARPTGSALPSLSFASLDTKLRLQIKEDSVNLGVTLAEYRQTARMFQKFGRGMRTIWRAFHGRLPRREQVKATPCTVAAVRLIDTYGIQPLAQDLFNSYEVLRGRLEHPLLKRYSVFDKQKASKTSVNGLYTTRAIRSLSYRKTCWVKFDPNPNVITVGNPLELAWEVIPFSFVVDWAIPIGDWLSSLDALLDVQWLEGTYTAKENLYWRTKYSISNSFGTHEIFGGGTYKSHQRVVFNTVPVQLPEYDPSTSLQAVANGLALLTGLNKRCKK